MPVTRILGGGKADLQGSLCGTLRVGDIQSRSPLRWAVTCEQCGACSVADHDALFHGSATCLSSTCRVTPEQRQSADESLSQYRRKQEKKDREQAAEREERERQQTEEIASRLADAQAELNKNTRELHRTMRARIERQRDDECYVDPATIGRTMGSAEAMEYNRAEAEAFMRDNPGAYYPCPENLASIGSYLERNGIQLASRRTLAAAVTRLRGVGLLIERPAPSPAPQSPQPKPAAAPYPAPTTVNAPPQKAPDADADATLGIDPATGRERSYNAREIDRMTALEYRKAFKIIKADLVLPNRNW